MKNTKKNRQNELLPSRKPRLGKFILAAVILHAVLAVFIIHFYKNKPEEQQGIKVKPEKVISKPLAKEVLHASSAESSATSFTQSRPMASSKIAAPDRSISDISPEAQHARRPRPLPALDVRSAQRLKPSGEQIHTSVDLDLQRTNASGAILALPKSAPEQLPGRPPQLVSKDAAVQNIVRTEGLPIQMHGEALTAAGPDRKAQVGFKIRSQPEYSSSLSSLTPSPRSHDIEALLDRFKKPKGLAGDIGELVTRLIQRHVAASPEPYVRIRVNNLTYRDKALESEGSKFLSGLVRGGVEKLDRAELLSPAEVSKTPHMEIEGEIWDKSTSATVNLRIKEHGTGRELDAAALKLDKHQLPEKMILEPPQGKSLDVIQNVVELMKQIFPQRGDFQLGVWTDKGMDAVYVEGETLMVYILPEKNAYLQVDYYQVDGKVVHLLPNVGENNFVEGGKPYIIGKSKSGKYKFVVGAPFGEELLVVLASQNPIKVVTQKIVEPANPYIQRLARSLRAQKTTAEMAGAHYIILTKARESETSKAQIQ
jgi:hypothetical protein